MDFRTGLEIRYLLCAGDDKVIYSHHWPKILQWIDDLLEMEEDFILFDFGPPRGYEGVTDRGRYFSVSSK